MMFEVAHKEATRAGGADAEVALVETLKGADLAMMFEVAREGATRERCRPVVQFLVLAIVLAPF